MLKEVKNPESWRNVRENPAYEEFINILKKKYEQSKTDVFLSLRYTVRRTYYLTNERGSFEAPYFNKREFAAVSAMLALIYPNNTEYLDSIQDILWNICDENSWIVPAHTENCYSGNLEGIDLFCAETGFMIAEICNLLGNRMDSIVRERAEAEVRRRVIQNFLERHYNWEDFDYNWAAVCAGSVAGIMMYLEPDTYRSQHSRILKTMEKYISGFPEDGTCLEGHSYWIYGFGYYCLYADLLYRFSGGKTELMQGEKIKNIARYIQGNFLKGNSTVSFSDGIPNGTAGMDMQYFLHKKFPGDVHILPRSIMKYAGINLHWRSYLRGIMYFDPALCTDTPVYEDVYRPDASQYIANREKYSFAIKGGNNAEPHNHNDIGSFILSAECGQVFCDLGAGRYTKEYFLPEHRYKYLATSSLGHSVPIINGNQQPAGEQFCGELSIEENGSVRVEFSDAYGIPGLKGLCRRVSFNENGVTLTDTIDAASLTVTERFVTKIKPELSDSCVTVAGVRLKFDGKKMTPHVKTEEFLDHGFNITAVPVYCIDFTLEKGAEKAEFIFEVN